MEGRSGGLGGRRSIEKGEWMDSDRKTPGDGWPPTLHGKRIGVYGMGAIGTRVARRMQGFETEIAYFSRSAKPGLPFERFQTLLKLAEWCDVLIACAPGGGETFHAIDAQVIRALGTRGFLVNVGRGSVVDSAALFDALEAGTLAGAGLDVWEEEPAVSDRMKATQNLVMTNHSAGLSPEAVEATTRMASVNLIRFFKGERPLNLI